MGTINQFQGEHRFLSNFFPHVFRFNDFDWMTAEHAFQAMKTRNPEEQTRIRNAATPGQAKRMGKQVDLRTDWEWVKVGVMAAIQWAKFSDARMARRLIETMPHKLEEGNKWGDQFWGVSLDTGRGANTLGTILMTIRFGLISEEKWAL